MASFAYSKLLGAGCRLGNPFALVALYIWMLHGIWRRVLTVVALLLISFYEYDIYEYDII